MATVSKANLSVWVASSGRQASAPLFWTGALLMALAIVVAVTMGPAEANSLGSVEGVQQQSHGYDNLENLISDFLTDAGDRLKKSKQNSLRQIKQTLRFGRRSDPMLAPTFDEHQAAPASFYELTNTNNQRLLADALAGDN